MRKEGETERQKQKRSEPNVLFVQTRMEHSPGLVRLSAARYSRFARQIKTLGDHETNFYDGPVGKFR